MTRKGLQALKPQRGVPRAQVERIEVDRIVLLIGDSQEGSATVRVRPGPARFSLLPTTRPRSGGRIGSVTANLRGWRREPGAGRIVLTPNRDS